MRIHPALWFAIAAVLLLLALPGIPEQIRSLAELIGMAGAEWYWWNYVGICIALVLFFLSAYPLWRRVTYFLLIHEAQQGCRDATYEPSRFPVAVPYPSPHRATPAYVVVTSSDLDTSRNKASVSGFSWISRTYFVGENRVTVDWSLIRANVKALAGLVLMALMLALIGGGIYYVVFVYDPAETVWEHPTHSTAEQKKARAECQMKAYDAIGSHFTDNTARGKYFEACLTRSGFMPRKVKASTLESAQ